MIINRVLVDMLEAYVLIKCLKMVFVDLVISRAREPKGETITHEYIIQTTKKRQTQN